MICYEYWSLRSNSTPDTKEMWTDREKEPDDMLMYTDRSDSGVTSPHSNHHVDDRNIISPCDLSLLDPVSNHELKRRITSLSKRSTIDDEDKMCLIQVINLINNLDALSQDSIMNSEDSISLELVKSKISDYSSLSSTPRSTFPISEKSKNSANRIIATVLPFSNTSTPTDSPSRKLRSWTSSSLQESGVFEGDTLDPYYNQSTQTEPEDFPCHDNPVTKDLCAEIQKLNKFREQIEECVTKSSNNTSKVGPVPLLSPNLSDQKRIQYYKDRLELLEKKLIVYESSGDVQDKLLAERLQREIHLESLVKELREKVENLENENLHLEEEKCEFEEAENDTRLRLQRLEVDLEIFSQRNLELEMSREALQGKLKDSKNQCSNFQDKIEEYEHEVGNLKEDAKELKDSLNLIKVAMPTLLLFNTLGVNWSDLGVNNDNNVNNLNHSCKCNNCEYKSDPFDKNEVIPKFSDRCQVDSETEQLQNQKLINKELLSQLDELKRTFQIAVENADEIWADIEKKLKDELMQAKMKIQQLEQRLTNDSQAAQERICQLEEYEEDLKYRYCKLDKEHKDLLAEHNLIEKEYQNVKDEFRRLKKTVDGPNRTALEFEKCRVKNLQDELKCVNKVVCDMEENHKDEIDTIRNQLGKVQKELLQIEVTNSELKEEVCTIEKEVTDLHKQKREDDDKIRCLCDEIRTKEEICAKLENRLDALEKNRKHSSRTFNANCGASQNSPSKQAPSLAQEMTDSPSKRLRIDEITDLRTASKKLGEVIDSRQGCNNCNEMGGLEMNEVAQDVKNLADQILGKRQNENTEEILNSIRENVTIKLFKFNSNTLKSKLHFTVFLPVEKI